MRETIARLAPEVREFEEEGGWKEKVGELSEQLEEERRLVRELEEDRENSQR